MRLGLVDVFRIKSCFFLLQNREDVCFVVVLFKKGITVNNVN